MAEYLSDIGSASGPPDWNATPKASVGASYKTYHLRNPGATSDAVPATPQTYFSTQGGPENFKMPNGALEPVSSSPSMKHTTNCTTTRTTTQPSNYRFCISVPAITTPSALPPPTKFLGGEDVIDTLSWDNSATKNSGGGQPPSGAEEGDRPLIQWAGAPSRASSTRLRRTYKGVVGLVGRG